MLFLIWLTFSSISNFIAIFILWNIEVLAHRFAGGHGHSHDIDTVKPAARQNSNLIEF